MEKIFQYGVPRNAVRLINVMAESEGRVDHWVDTLYLTTLVQNMQINVHTLAFFNFQYFLTRQIGTCSYKLY